MPLPLETQLRRFFAAFVSHPAEPDHTGRAHKSTGDRGGAAGAPCGRFDPIRGGYSSATAVRKIALFCANISVN